MSTNSSVNSTNSHSLIEKLKELKAKKFSENFKQEFADRIPTDLNMFLILYSKSRTECYINYMEGAAALISFLAPIQLPTSILIEDESFKINDLLISYEVQKLAELLQNNLTEPASCIKIEKAIIHSLPYFKRIK
jgi:hypothetical protein